MQGIAEILLFSHPTTWRCSEKENRLGELFSPFARFAYRINANIPRKHNVSLNISESFYLLIFCLGSVSRRQALLLKSSIIHTLIGIFNF